jgi:hypothetical protein
MTKKNVKIGDVFSVHLEDKGTKYFQYIANDRTQLNSNVIRCFKKVYSLTTRPNLSEIVKGEVEFFAHCIIKLGLKMNLWESFGNIEDIGNITEILFRDTNDYGSMVGEEPVKISNKWYVWHINDKDFNRVGKLDGENRKAHVGLVINPLGIIELIKGKRYPPNYPKFK